MLSARIILPQVLALLVAGCVAPYFGIETGQKATADSRYMVRKNIVYTPENWPVPVMADLYRPPGKAPAPAVLLVHGGGWTGSDGRWQMDPIAKKLARRGYAVLNATYRLAPRWTYPAPIEDLQEAVKWMRDHAAEEGIDPNRIAAYGYSAGGYLATLTGLNDDMHIRAIVAGGTPSDLTFYHGGSLVPQFLGTSLRANPGRFYEASPVNHVTPNSPPVFIYHGTADQLVQPEHAMRLAAAFERNNVPHETYWIEGRDHIAAFLLPGESVDRAIDFLDRTMK